VTRDILERIAELLEGMLQGQSEQQLPTDDRTLLGAISFLLHHESYHIGQMGLLRRLLGYPSMSYTVRADGGGTPAN